MCGAVSPALSSHDIPSFRGIRVYLSLQFLRLIQIMVPAQGLKKGAAESTGCGLSRSARACSAHPRSLR